MDEYYPYTIARPPFEQPPYAPPQVPQQQQPGMLGQFSNFMGSMMQDPAFAYVTAPYGQKNQAMMNASFMKQRMEERKQEREDRKAAMDANRKSLLGLRQQVIKAATDPDSPGGRNFTPYEEMLVRQIDSSLTTNQPASDLYSTVGDYMRPPDPTSPMQHAQTLARGRGLDPNDPRAMADALVEVLRLGQDQVTVNTGTAKPLEDKAPLWRNSAGEPAHPMMTPQQASDQGYMPMLPADVQKMSDTREKAPAMGSMIGWGFETESGGSLFPPANASDWGRLWDRGRAAYHHEMQSPEHPDLVLYNNTKESTLAGIARLVGHVGVLTELDVASVRNLWPKAWFTPENIAARQFIYIGAMLKGKGLTDQHLRDAGFPEWVIDGKVPAFPKREPQYSDLPGNN